jgi:selenocysteine lyase/cysteine desulfurase
VIDGWESDELMQLLKERGIRVRTIDKAIRVSIGYFTQAEELTALTDALREIVQAGHKG